MYMKLSIYCDIILYITYSIPIQISFNNDISSTLTLTINNDLSYHE
jgi:hypothetical protein